jgi:putative ATP-binding cassette transporter
MSQVREPGPSGIFAVLAAFFAYAGGFWTRSTRVTAIGLTIMLAIALLGRLAVDLGVNTWNRWFFDSLEARNGAALLRSVWMFAGLLICLAAVGAAVVYLRETLQVAWRAWLTKRLLNDWLTGSTDRQHHLHDELENAEYRISDDVRMATEPMVDFGIGFFSATITGLSFLGVLWTVGGSLTISGTTIPAYFVLAALLYGALTNVLVPLVGRHITPVTSLRNEAEARFRSALIRSREAVNRTEGDMPARKALRGGLVQSYAGVVSTWTELVRQHVRLTWLTNANSALTPVIPLLLGAPGYLSGQLTIGQIVQLALAFTQVQLAIGWLVDNYMRIAEWRASALRIITMSTITGEGDVHHDSEPPAADPVIPPAAEPASVSS